MAYQMTFKRYELKYLLTVPQKEQLLTLMAMYMELDGYGRSTIRNIYYDTDSCRLARRSMEKPEYKEKLRVRSYMRAAENDAVFVELKKKYKSVVYKRRVSLPGGDAEKWLRGAGSGPGRGQICDEIEYFRDYYETLHPVAFLSYEREAFRSTAGEDLRLTFDERILGREDELTLDSEPGGAPLIDEGYTLMELKTSMAIPLWLNGFLTRQHIYKTSFSKYGEAYRRIITKNSYGGLLYA